jgi:nucleoside-diphosphate-sugar epimerase
MKKQNLPKILLTGASGFIGSNLIKHLNDRYYIYAFARRTQQEAGILTNKNIKWILVDIAQESNLAAVIQNIKKEGGVDYIIHFAAYYDFGNDPHPEYDRTNVKGTRLLLKYSKELGIKRFIFASSIAACSFPSPGETINERSPLDADFPYAVSKRRCEEMIEEISDSFPCTIFRFAAVYSDWCEYGPLYMFLKTCLSSSWMSRIIGGKAESAIPYIHINCVLKAISIVLEKSDQLPQFDTYIVTPDNTTSHRELFELANRLYSGKRKNPICIPKWLAIISVYARDFLGRLMGKRPFIRPWMMKYIDLKLSTDSAYTRQVLNWKPMHRLHINRRLLFLMENLKVSPVKWHHKNAAAFKRPRLERPNLILSEVMQNRQEGIIDQILKHLLSPDHSDQFEHYQDLYDSTRLKWYVESVYNLLISSVRHGDRYAFIPFGRSLANLKIQEGFYSDEVSNALYVIENHVRSILLPLPETKDMEMLIHDSITLSIQLAVDELEDSYQRITGLTKQEMDEDMGVKPNG